jgi:hypothetical protein
LVPHINTGIAGREPGVGMVGAGLVEAPMECFVTAVNRLAGGEDFRPWTGAARRSYRGETEETT